MLPDELYRLDCLLVYRNQYRKMKRQVGTVVFQTMFASDLLEMYESRIDELLMVISINEVYGLDTILPPRKRGDVL